ncbi:hypothetical protein [Ramlibacter sp.]|uniref:hypothetical protein n=1 Tax=Ramlibacter sp. TaxID=1917967 RepID=UPI00262695D2|nr:hypothetical protein [Ramlibacter sp.]MDB5955631.1 hypothetical protein [Ramlibacter sp.]
MSHGTPSPELTVLRIAACLAALALCGSAVAALLMKAGVLPASPTRFAALGVAALAFANWLVRLLLEMERRRSSPGPVATTAVKPGDDHGPRSRTIRRPAWH